MLVFTLNLPHALFKLNVQLEIWLIITLACIHNQWKNKRNDTLR